MSLTVETTLARVALRQMTANRRMLWLCLFAALPVLLSALIAARTTGDDVLRNLVGQYTILAVPVLLPLVALVIGTGVFGGEIDDGTITYVLGKPVPRWRIVVTRVVVAGLATAAVMVPPTLVSGLVMARGFDAGGVVVAFTVAVAVGGLLYCALFVALSLRTRRALVAGLVYVLVWEGAMSNFFAGTKALSVRQYTLALADALSTTRPQVFDAELSGGTALVMAVVVGALAVGYSVRRLQRFEIGEAV